MNKSILDQIEKYSSFNDLAHLLSSQIVYAEFWISRYSQENVKKLNICYGLVSEARSNDASSWKASGFKSVFSEAHISDSSPSYRVAKISIFAKGENIRQMVDGLLTGANLKVASEQAALPAPSEKFHEVTLFNSGQKNSYVLRPTVTALPVSVLKNFTNFRQGYSSPIKSSLARVGSLYLLDKEEIWRDHKGQISKFSKEILKDLTIYLGAQTGLQFNQFDLKRIGNIEWISYNSIDKFENSYCSVSTVKKFFDKKTGALVPSETPPSFYEHTLSATEIKVTLRDEGVPADVVEILIECSAYNDNDLLDDQAVVIEKRPGLEAHFNFDEQVSSCKVKVWIKKDPTTAFSLWHHEEFDLIRAINFTTNFSDQFPDNTWFDNLVSDSKTSKSTPKEKLSAVRPNHNNFQLDPWNPVGNALHQLKDVLFPVPSDAFFFASPGEDDAPRINELAGWLQKTIQKRKPDTCILFDPYFDLLGIDLLAKLQGIQTNFIVVTNSQIKSNDDEQISTTDRKDAENIPSRAIRIKEHCEKKGKELSLYPLKIYDLVSKSGSPRQYFHDRHLLFFDSKGTLKSGYNLSNSIQGAMKKYPLLITPIPSDILERVQEYTYNFLSVKANLAERKMTLLFPPERPAEKKFEFKNGIDSLSFAPELFSILLQNPTLKNMPKDQFRDWLLTNDFLDKDNKFQSEKIISCRKNILAHLNSLPANFWQIWCDLSEVLARIHDYEVFFEDLRLYPALVAKINNLLASGDIKDTTEFFTYELDLDSLEKHLGLKSENFSKALSKARHVDHMTLRHYVKIHRYGIEMALRLLHSSNDLVTLVDKISAANEAESYTNKALRLRTIEQICLYLELSPDKILLEDLTKSKLPVLRALAGLSIYEHRNSVIFNLEWMRPLYSLEEFLLVISEWIYDLRIRANQKGGTISEADGVLFQKLAAEIVIHWNFSLEHLRDILTRCSGPTFGSWSISNYNDICDPLVEAHKINYTQLAKIWLQALIEKIEKVRNKKEYFNEPADSQLTAVAAHIFLHLDHDIDTVHMNRITKLITSSLQQIERPRIKSIDYDLWSSNTSALLWLHSFLIHIKRMAGASHSPTLEEVLKLEGQIAPFTLNEHLEHGHDSLYEWLKRVDSDLHPEN